VHGGSARAFSNSVSKKGNEVLVLTRKRGQIVRINDDISIEILKIRGHSVSIGIQAPKEVAIHREEVYKKIEEAA